MPGKAHTHTAKWRRCVEAVQGKNPGVDAYAVCTAQLGPSLLADTDVDLSDDGKPFVWNGAGTFGKPFKKKPKPGAAVPDTPIACATRVRLRLSK